MNYAINFYDTDGSLIEKVSVSGRVPLEGEKIVTINCEVFKVVEILNIVNGSEMVTCLVNAQLME
jgi:hypothetical protein|nr:MAG TPA: Protein of unknown function (DUF1425) [Caudoviricetes sp.]